MQLSYCLTPKKKHGQGEKKNNFFGSVDLKNFNYVFKDLIKNNNFDENRFNLMNEFCKESEIPEILTQAVNSQRPG